MVKYEWDESNGVSVPTNKLMAIDADEYYVGMPLKKVDASTVAPTDGDPEYICLAQRNAGDEIRPLQIPVQEVFPDAVYTKILEDGTEEKVKFGGGGKIKPEQLPDGYPYEEEESFTVEHIPTLDNWYETTLAGFPLFASGDTVNVTVDGVEYSLEANYDNYGDLLVGDNWEDFNSETMESNGEYGWLIYVYEDYVAFYSYSNHTVSWTIRETHHIDPKFLPEGYPYEEKTYITIAEEQSATHKKTFLSSNVDGYYNNKGYLDGNKIIAGNTYIVYVDGVAYEGVAYEGVTEEGYTRLCIFGPDNDIFPTAPINIVIGTSVARGTACAVYFSDGGTHDVKVDLCERTLEKLDPKFLPEGYPYMGEGVIALKYDSSQFTTLNLLGFPSFKVGDTVSIKVDGIGHSLVAFLESINGFDYIVIGDSSYDLENKTGEYGWQVYVPPEDELILFRSNGIHTVSWNVPKAYPIDPKFLPAGIGDVLNVLIIEPSNNSFTCNKTYNEIKEALLNNVPVLAIISVRYGNGAESPQQNIYQQVEYSVYDSAIYFKRGEGAVDLVLTSDNVVRSNSPM